MAGAAENKVKVHTESVDPRPVATPPAAPHPNAQDVAKLSEPNGAAAAERKGPSSPGISRGSPPSPLQVHALASGGGHGGGDEHSGRSNSSFILTSTMQPSSSVMRSFANATRSGALAHGPSGAEPADFGDSKSSFMETVRTNLVRNALSPEHTAESSVAPSPARLSAIAAIPGATVVSPVKENTTTNTTNNNNNSGVKADLRLPPYMHELAFIQLKQSTESMLRRQHDARSGGNAASKEATGGSSAEGDDAEASRSGSTATAVTVPGTASPANTALDKSRAERRSPSSSSSDGGGGVGFGGEAAGEEHERNFVRNLRSVVSEADNIDEMPSPLDRNHSMLHWRDDDDVVQSPSVFFRHSATLDRNNNTLPEMIDAKGRPVQGDDELRWLYRHCSLLSLLDSADLDSLIPHSLRREYTKGDVIVGENAVLTHVFVIIWGNVEVFQRINLDREKKALEETFYVGARAHSSSLNSADHHRRACQAPHIAVVEREAPYLAADARAAQERERDDTDLYTHTATLKPGQVFGLEGYVFLEPSKYVFRAGGWKSKTVVVLIPHAAVQSALARNTRFAQGVGTAIVSSVDVFGPIRQFCRFVFSPTVAQNEYLPLWSIVDQYTRIHNVIHTKMLSKELDTGAWGYAINRLPENITSTFCFDLMRGLPPFVASRMRNEARVADVRSSRSGADLRRARTDIVSIFTKERRRCSWHLGMEGKTLVLLRDGFTDLLDFLTMLCVHIIESSKLRGRIQGMVHPPAIDILDAYLRQREEEKERGRNNNNNNNNSDDAATREADVERIKSILQRMPLLEEERVGLMRLWGRDTLLRIYEIMMHREEYNVRVDPSISRNFQTDFFHEWALNLRRCVLEKMGLSRFSPLPDDLCVDVISSNTHCIKNLLSSFLRKYRKEILEYAAKQDNPPYGRAEQWHNVDDMLYIASNGFLQSASAEIKEEYQRSIEASGITILQDTAMTGLQVDVIPVHQLDLDSIDETVRQSLQDKLKAMLVAQDGEQQQQQRQTVALQDRVQKEHPTSNNNNNTSSSSSVPSWAELAKPLYTASQDKSHPLSPPNAHPSNAPSDASRTSSPSFPVPNGRRSYGSPTVLNVATEAAPGAAGTNGPEESSTAAAASCRADGPHPVRRLPRHFIINMDFAFGAQATGICRAVFSVFGKSIRSVSVMGKAGGLQGKRGDIQLASHVLLSKSSLILEDNQDELRVCRNQDLTEHRLRELAGPRVTVHHGKMLTVTGTILQNATLLRYYRSVWHCIGTEMEGSYFARVIEDFYRQGIASPKLITRFAYYSSDLPLAKADAEVQRQRNAPGPTVPATLSAPMTPLEGVPPLYAIARSIIENVLLG